MIREGAYYKAEANILAENIKANKTLNNGPGGAFSYAAGGGVVFYSILEEGVQDSSNSRADDFVGITKIVQRNYCKYDAFVVIHGTDTMAYAASAVSFMVENISKPIIFTGSMVPMVEPGSDAVSNLAGVFHRLIVGVRPNVYIFFCGKLLPANRSTKIDTTGFDAFASVPGTASPAIRGEVRFRPTMTGTVALLKITPYVSLELIKAVLLSSTGVVIETFGSGNISEPLLEVIKAHSGDSIIVNISQCTFGRVVGNYHTGWLLGTFSNVISGEDMTAEAALAKLSFLLANYGREDVKRLFRENLRGEVTFIG